MNVKLLAYTPAPERTVACAAKLCYAAADIDTVMDGLTDEKAGSFLDMLTEIGHESPIEHASFTFGIEGVSRSLLAQITRHRLASYSVQSQRYVKESSFEFVVPPEIAAMPEARREFLMAMEEDTGIPLRELRVDGGACANHFLMQFQADIMDRPLRRPMIRETTALGAAYLAGLSTGVWSSLEDIRGSWTLDRLYKPDMEAEQRLCLLSGWHEAVERVRSR